MDRRSFFHAAAQENRSKEDLLTLHVGWGAGKWIQTSTAPRRLSLTKKRTSVQSNNLLAIEQRLRRQGSGRLKKQPQPQWCCSNVNDCGWWVGHWRLPHWACIGIKGIPKEDAGNGEEWEIHRKILRWTTTMVSTSQRKSCDGYSTRQQSWCGWFLAVWPWIRGISSCSTNCTSSQWRGIGTREMPHRISMLLPLQKYDAWGKFKGLPKQFSMRKVICIFSIRCIGCWSAPYWCLRCFRPSKN